MGVEIHEEEKRIENIVLRTKRRHESVEAETPTGNAGVSHGASGGGACLSQNADLLSMVFDFPIEKIQQFVQVLSRDLGYILNSCDSADSVEDRTVVQSCKHAVSLYEFFLEERIRGEQVGYCIVFGYHDHSFLSWKKVLTS